MGAHLSSSHVSMLIRERPHCRLSNTKGQNLWRISMFTSLTLTGWVRARWDDHPFAHSPSWLPTPRFHRQLTWAPALLLSGLSGRTLIEIISDDIICLMVTLWPWGQTTYIPLYLGTFENSQIELEHFFISKVAKNKIIAFHWSPFAPDHNWGET